MLQGKAELKKIAEIYKTRFPQLFGSPHKQKNFNLLATNTARTIDSFNVFFDTILGKTMRESVAKMASEADEEIIKV